MASSITVTILGVTTNTIRFSLGNNASSARMIQVSVYQNDSSTLVYQNSYYLPPFQNTTVTVSSLSSSTSYRIMARYNTEETIAYATTQTPSKTITGRVNVVKRNTIDIQGRIFVVIRTVTEISGKVCVRIATPEKLPEDWRYDNEPQPEDWDNVEKDATSWEETDKAVDSWSENEKENVNWQRGEEAHHQKWKYPLKDTG